MIKHNEVRKDTYFDSVTLMMASSKMCEVSGVRNAAIMMGTDHNRDLMAAAGLINESAGAFSANDAVLGICAEDETALGKALAALAEYFDRKTAATSGAQSARTLEGALRQLPDMNLAIISLPGRYATAEANKALDLGLHILLFSDNVSVEDEIRLKDKALEKGLLMMGPDCGTALINGVALGFANVVKRGDIGIVAAAGTGLQEVTVLVDRFGGGISQALGTGGRDVKEAVGGRMMGLCLDALDADDETKVIVIVSKPPHPSVMKQVAARLAALSKPVVACFLGGDPVLLEGTGAHFVGDLEEAAARAVELSCGVAVDDECLTEDQCAELAIAELARFAPTQRFLRGLYSGGTLCYEAILALTKAGIPVHSNIALTSEWQLEDVEHSRETTVIDMGDDYFTNGMPHPMIDPRLRVERLEREGADEQVAVLLLDCVTGYGSHENPAGVLASAIRDACAQAEASGGHLCVIASVCGTDGDPQKRSEQIDILRQAGAHVLGSNAQAVRLATRIMQGMATGAAVRPASTE
jgi:succinyl-CoA synthetase alpha subunit